MTHNETTRSIRGQGQVLAEYDGSGTWLYNYIYANGRKVGRDATGTANDRWYHNDMLGSARQMSANGGYSWTRDYYPFGSDRNATGTGNDFKFTGQEEDGELGLYYYGARYYDPALGRFTQVDPLAGKYAGWSPYSYALDNPLKYVDPDGEIIVDTHLWGHAIGNTALVVAAGQFDAAVANRLGISVSDYQLEIVGGDRILGGNGIALSATDDTPVLGSKSSDEGGSPHQIGKGARALDFRMPGDPRLTLQVLSQAVDDVNRLAGRIVFNQFLIYAPTKEGRKKLNDYIKSLGLINVGVRSGDPHLHLSISSAYSARGSYEKGARPFASPGAARVRARLNRYSAEYSGVPDL